MPFGLKKLSDKEVDEKIAYHEAKLQFEIIKMKMLFKTILPYVIIIIILILINQLR